MTESTIDLFRLRTHPVVCENCWHVNCIDSTWKTNVHYRCGNMMCSREIFINIDYNEPLVVCDIVYCYNFTASDFYLNLMRFKEANKDYLSGEDELLDRSPVIDMNVRLELFLAWALYLHNAVENKVTDTLAVKRKLYDLLKCSLGAFSLTSK